MARRQGWPRITLSERLRGLICSSIRYVCMYGARVPANRGFRTIHRSYSTLWPLLKQPWFLMVLSSNMSVLHDHEPATYVSVEELRLYIKPVVCIDVAHPPGHLTLLAACEVNHYPGCLTIILDSKSSFLSRTVSSHFFHPLR